MAADAVKNSFVEALPAALAVEIFHNFSLVHDDIMDEAHCEGERLQCMKSGI